MPESWEEEVCWAKLQTANNAKATSANRCMALTSRRSCGLLVYDSIVADTRSQGLVFRAAANLLRELRQQKNPQRIGPKNRVRAPDIDRDGVHGVVVGGDETVDTITLFCGIVGRFIVRQPTVSGNAGALRALYFTFTVPKKG